MSPPGTRKEIVAIYAHPDDGELFAGGTLAKWAAAGHRIHSISCTDGALGTKRLGLSPAEIASARARELAKAVQTIGGDPPIFLGFPDGDLRAHGDALYERLVYWLRKLRADRVVTFDPWKRYEIHPDHIEAGRRASEAAVFACFPNLFPAHQAEGLEAWQPSEVWYMTPTEHRPNRIVDIAATLPKKVEALLCHESQVEMLADWFVAGADPRNLTEAERGQLRDGATRYLTTMAEEAARLAPGKVSLAEAFYALATGPGHFDNYKEMMQETLGVVTDPEIA